jgi:hypothetical protein
MSQLCPAPEAKQLPGRLDSVADLQVPVSDTTPDYNEFQAFLATPTQWKYRASCRMDGEQVGQWSDETSITARA